MKAKDQRHEAQTRGSGGIDTTDRFGQKVTPETRGHMQKSGVGTSLQSQIRVSAAIQTFATFGLNQPAEQ